MLGRGLSILLALTMLLSVGAVTAFAEGETDDSTSEVSVLEPGEYIVPLSWGFLNVDKQANIAGSDFNVPISYDAQALLTIDADGTKKVTINFNGTVLYEG